MRVTYTIEDEHGDEIETRRVALDDLVERPADEDGDLCDVLAALPAQRR